MIKNSERVTIKVSKEKRAEYEALAEKMGITLSGLIKIAVAQFIKNNK
jgi:antitoxin component of RelBE/YafQ-DinJ toxin-antitoxin module